MCDFNYKQRKMELNSLFSSSFQALVGKISQFSKEIMSEFSFFF
jgi:hypothetical protein